MMPGTPEASAIWGGLKFPSVSARRMKLRSANDLTISISASSVLKPVSVAMTCHRHRASTLARLSDMDFDSGDHKSAVSAFHQCANDTHQPSATVPSAPSNCASQS